MERHWRLVFTILLNFVFVPPTANLGAAAAPAPLPGGGEGTPAPETPAPAPLDELSRGFIFGEPIV